MMREEIDIAEALRLMPTGDWKVFRAPGNHYGYVVDKKGDDEFRVDGQLPTSYPNTVRLLRSKGIEAVAK
jgi:hypothetical protein